MKMNFGKLAGKVRPRTFFYLFNGLSYWGSCPGTSFSEFCSSELWSSCIKIFVVHLCSLSQVVRLIAVVYGVRPKVEAPEGSGCGSWAIGGCGCLGLVPEVEGVGEECGMLVAGNVFEPDLGGEAGGSGGTGGATRRNGLAGVGGVLVVDGSSGWSLGTEVQLYWNLGTVSSSPVKNM